MPDQAQGLRELMAAHDHAQSLPIQSESGLDKAKLWDWLKGELEMEISRGDMAELCAVSTDGIEKAGRRARRMLERMERAETLAQFQQRGE